jgi:hypothetical protein
MSVVSILGGFSAVNILQNPANISIPSAPVTGTLNISNPSGMYLEIPYSLTNTGYFDLTDLSFDLDIFMIYNISRIRTKILDDSYGFPDIIHGQTQTGIYNATSFIIANIPSPTKIDSSPVNFTGDISFRATYSLGLLAFIVNIYNQSFGP